MKLWAYILFFATLLVLPGCKTDDDNDTGAIITLQKEAPLNFRSPEKLVAFIDDKENGFVKVKKINEYTYSAVLKPIDYLLSKKRIEENNPALNKKDFEDLQYFDLRIKVEEFQNEFIKYNLESTGEYQERVQYCAFEMQKDIKLVDGKDTLPCVLYHYERAFNIVPYGHFTLGFEPGKSNTVNTKVLIFSDQLFKNGIIKFTFSPKIMVNEPKLL